jgi:mannosyltransferase OCH1-like enzyme
MIPKIIHYCWFGGNPLDDAALKCINSWKTFFPDYEIIQWNETNFDLSQIEFMQKAYNDKKWAFVSDVARLLILYSHGGFYFDTDVEVLRSFDDIIKAETKGFFGLEKNGLVASGLGCGSVAEHPFLRRHIEVYKKINYDTYKDNLSDIACPRITTYLLEQEGFIRSNTLQCVSDFMIYPSEYFSPIDYNTGKMKRTKHTHSIHWYNASWQDARTKEEQEKLRFWVSLLGCKMGEIIHGITSTMRKEGVRHYIQARIRKYIKRGKQT